MAKYEFGLCAGRHACPVDQYLYPNELTTLDTDTLVKHAHEAIPEDATLLKVYVTGFTPAMLAVVRACFERRITLVAYNYDRNTNKYVMMPIMMWADHIERVPAW